MPSPPTPQPSPIKGEGAKAFNTPAFQQWVRATQALPAEKQIEAVSKKLMELNPGFDGNVRGVDLRNPPQIEKGAVTQLGFYTDNVADISPVRALAGLKEFNCKGSGERRGLTDLSPLQGMSLAYINCGDSMVSDLSPLRGMPLGLLHGYYSLISDLSPLQECKRLNRVDVKNTKVTPASVAALQKALPNCKIEWDGAARPEPSAVAQGDPDRRAAEWILSVGGVMDVTVAGQTKRISKSESLPQEPFRITWTALPLRGKSDLERLAGLLSLAGLHLNGTPLHDAGLQLLPDLPELKLLSISGTSITDVGLATLERLPKLEELLLNNTRVTDNGLKHLEHMPALKHLVVTKTKVTAAGVAALQKVLPNCKIEWDDPTKTLLPPGEGGRRPDEGPKTWETPAFQQWVAATKGLPAEQQIEAVSKKLMELNPGFDGRVTGPDSKSPPKIENGVATELKFISDEVTDLSPVRALAGLWLLYCPGSDRGKGRLSDLAPLQGMKLRSLYCNRTNVTNLSPLRGAPLTHLSCDDTRLSDLSPLQDCKSLGRLFVRNANVTAASVAALQAALPNCKIEWDDPSKAAPSPQPSPTKGEGAKGPSAPAPAGDFERAAAEWVLSKGGKVTIRVGDQTRQATSVSELPSEPLAVIRIDFFTSTNVIKLATEDLQRLKPLASLTDLNLGYTDLSDDALPIVCEMRQLRFVGAAEKMTADKLGLLHSLSGLFYVALSGEQVSPALRSLTGLTKIYLMKPDDASLAVISQLPTLNNLTLSGGTITGKGLHELQKLTGLKSLGIIGKNMVTADDVTALKKALPDCRIEWPERGQIFGESAPPAPQPSPTKGEGVSAWNTPAFQLWVKDTQALPAEKQIEAVSKKLMELNPGFDGRLTDKEGKGPPKIENGMVTELKVFADNVADISPVRALQGLQDLNCFGSAQNKGRLSDLSPLQGMKLAKINCANTQVSDLSPLKGMPLKFLGCHYTQVSDLSPLEGMPLATLWCYNTPISDLSPLGGLPLTSLTCSSTPISDLSALRGLALTSLTFEHTRVSDLSPLRGMPLKFLSCWDANLSSLAPLEGMKLTELHCGDNPALADLSPLKGMPLTTLHCDYSSVSDLTPLQGMSLVEVIFTPKMITRGLDILRQMKSLKVVAIYGDSRLPPAEFWKKYDAGEFGRPGAAVNDPAFQAWIIGTQALPAEKQIETVTKKLIELNPRFDGALTGLDGQGGPKIDSGVVTELRLSAINVHDISPLRALAGLKALACVGSPGKRSPLFDLSPLHGMRLTKFDCPYTSVFDLSPLEGMPLTVLSCYSAKVADLAPLRGMPLAYLNCNGDRVSDLSPLEDCKNLDGLSVAHTNVPLAGVAALQKKLPNCKIEWPTLRQLYRQPAALGFNDPAFQQWVKGAQALPAERQIEAVSKKLMELNPGFDGKLTGRDGKSPPKIENGLVTELWFSTDNVTDISPVRALGGLKTLGVRGSLFEKSKLADLSPLHGMQLTNLDISFTQASDLSPLQGMPLNELNCFEAKNVSDLSPLRGMSLKSFNCPNTRISNLSPLSGMPLTYLNCNSTPTSDLSPLRGMRLTNFSCYATQVSDLSPLQGMPLTSVGLTKTPVVDLAPLHDCKSLKTIYATDTKITPAAVTALQKVLPNCKIEWDGAAPSSAAPESAKPKTPEPAASGAK